MPQVTVYIRKEDLEVWNNIGKKAEFLHNALRTADAYKSMPPAEREAVKRPVAGMPTKLTDIRKTLSDMGGMRFCPNGHAKPEGRDKCSMKGCKYA